MTVAPGGSDGTEPLPSTAIVRPADSDTFAADVVIIGSGMGGSTVAWALKDSGLSVLVVERGHFLPREPENASVEEMFIKKRYKTAEPWFDGHTGQPFDPGVHYWVGGNTKFYGASLSRFRRTDFEEVQHYDGISPKWPFSYGDMEPYYCAAETLYEVHGRTGEDPTEPPRSCDFPYPALDHEPAVERFAGSLKRQGLHPYHMSCGMNVQTMDDRRAVEAADGLPVQGAKSDAENRALRPALRSGNVRILIDTRVDRLLTQRDGSRVVAAQAVVNGQPILIQGDAFVVCAGAVNSATLLMRSATDTHPNGLANSSGLLGRNYMVHNSTFLVGVSPFRRNRTAWQKTLGVNDWYVAGPDTPYPLGNLQMLGKLQSAHIKGVHPWAPRWALTFATDRSLDLYLTTEDLPRRENRVRIDGDRTILEWTPNNVTPHVELVRRVSRAVRKAGYPITVTERKGITANGHMCGTAVAGADARDSVLDPWCRSHDVPNLWIVDGSFFPSSAALNPALTIAANALRVAPKLTASLRS
ncbi:dehydrogenase [Mycobacterium sp. 1164966.3]|uniref:GMC oxidoreductase n=1 Tax=Mycobacterium sp. 1164966.3 TaxID=1856861 RepID=UPI0008003927|nr:GMC family oxidoreductase [Mycobacterium sp. 1164966.3]OBA82149.1 dehydrogenase [Mycobacterium sp. 1164966.3]